MGLEAKELERLRGAPVRSQEGEILGSLDLIMVDRVTREPEWIGVRIEGDEPGWLPIPVVAVRAEGAEVLIAYPKEQVQGAPTVMDSEIGEAEERSLYDYFGIDRSKEESPSGLPDSAAQPPEDQRVFRVTHKQEGGWSVVEEGSGQVVASTRLKKEAVQKAKRLARSEGADLVIQKVDGEVQEELSYSG
jgi:Uncharacterized protein conserved in bacteria (DUF2188)/PRC-barrel domain